MRIAIVNDVKMTREFLKLLVGEMKGHSVAWMAENGADAVEKCKLDIPDLILMDLIMPVMDGVKATKLIMKNTPCAILIVTASVGANAPKVFEAMGYGALDVVRTPSIMQRGEQLHGADLKKKIEIINKFLRMPPLKEQTGVPTKARARKAVPPLLVMGASTGGPMALAKVLAKLPSICPLCIVVVQHVDEQFAEGLAQWLAKQISLPVALAKECDELTQGKVLIAGKDMHLCMTEDLCLHYQDDPCETPYRPSVDVFFQSIATHWPTECMAILLTGMGSDGAHGLKMLRDKGWHTIAQDQASCVVFGMPKAAIDIGAAQDVLSTDEIAATILQYIKKTMGKKT